MPEKILIVRSILLRQGMKKASDRGRKRATAAVSALRAHAPASPPAPRPRTDTRRSPFGFMISASLACAASPGFHNVQSECSSSASPISSSAAAAGSSARGSCSSSSGCSRRSKLGDRWFESFSIPGYAAYEANQRTLKTFGSGEQPPLVAVFRSNGDVTQGDAGSPRRSPRRGRQPGLADELVLHDRHRRLRLEGPAHDVRRDLSAGQPGFNSNVHIKQVRAALKANAPPGVTVHLTGRDPLYEDVGGSGGPSVLRRGPDRRPRRAARAAVRLRHAARGRACRWCGRGARS